MVRVAEERVMGAPNKLDPTWQEMLNQANMKVNEASQEKQRIQKIHAKSAKIFQTAEGKKVDLQLKLQKYIAKSKPYFQMQAEFQDKLEATTKKLNMLELELLEARQNYNIALKRLRRSGMDCRINKTLLERGMGVGAETPQNLPQSVGGLLHKPALDFLEKESLHSKPDGALDETVEVAAVDTLDATDEAVATHKRTKLHYNPYDLLYLTDIGSDSTSNIGSDEENDYIQDF
uniref:SH3 domain-binding protein 5 n=1 Tax=Ciona savignyi TaxID=51511 RepID=H2Y5S8_CIOSA